MKRCAICQRRIRPFSGWRLGKFAPGEAPRPWPWSDPLVYLHDRCYNVIAGMQRTFLKSSVSG